MASKTLYVVTLTDVSLVSQSVNVFVLGYSEELDDARNFLKNEYDSLCKLGYDTSRFEHSKIGFIYKSDYRIMKYELHVATNIDVHEELAPQSELVSTPIKQNILYDYNNNKKRNIMATKKVYPFIHAEQCDEGSEDYKKVVFDAREVESYSFSHREASNDIEEDDAVTVCFKSGKEITLYLDLDQELYPGDDLITRIDRVQNSHFWHDNEDSTPGDDED